MRGGALAAHGEQRRRDQEALETGEPDFDEGRGESAKGSKPKRRGQNSFMALLLVWIYLQKIRRWLKRLDKYRNTTVIEEPIFRLEERGFGITPRQFASRPLFSLSGDG